MSLTNEFISKAEKTSAHNYKPLPIVIKEAKGVYVTDVEGKKYMDMLSAYSALNHGHLNEKIIKRAKDQLDKLTLTSRAFHSDKFADFTEKITKLTGYDMILPMNTGAEAVETAIKLIRKWAYVVKKIPRHKAEIIVCDGNFHGRTVTIISFSTEEEYKNDFGPFTPGFKVIKYGCIKSFKSAINENTAALLIEPIQGEGGIIMPNTGFLKEAKDICEENNILFVADEIQTGLGRTGKMFCHEWENIKADISIIGKALGGGILPISGVLANKEIMGLFKPGEHGSTFGGNPLACEVAMAAMDVLLEDDLINKSNEMGNYLMEKLRTLKSSVIKQIRGKGLLIGIELNEKARKYCEELMDLGLLCKETHENVIRLAPPLVITKEEIDEAFSKIEKVLK
jgi:ornithine--oxo-acid transaminase